jgi:HD-GYP domain-containing protein (c-di-GMP phosphodiesterase class II)
MAMDKRPLLIEDLVVGKALLWDVYDANEILLLRRGQVIASQRQMESMLERGLFVDITEYARFSRRPDTLTGTAPQEKKESRSALRLLNQANQQLEQILLDIPQQTGGTQVSESFRAVADKIKEAIEINPDVTLACILFSQKSRNYAARHCVASAIVSVMTAQSMQKPVEEINAIACAALSMNVSLWALQEVLQSRATGPTPEETIAIRQHPEESVRMLRQAGVTDEAWLSYVLGHHENVDGSGYPSGKSGDEIPANARLISLADRYTALLAPRAYRESILPSEVLRNILLERGKGVDATMAAHLIRLLGIYPPGAFVKLNNGETAIVSKRTKNSTTPIVHSLLTQRGFPLPFPHRHETENPHYTIREPVRVDWAHIPFTMQHIWGKEASE